MVAASGSRSRAGRPCRPRCGRRCCPRSHRPGRPGRPCRRRCLRPPRCPRRRPVPGPRSASRPQPVPAAARATATATATCASRLGAGIFKESAPRADLRPIRTDRGAPDAAKECEASLCQNVISMPAEPGSSSTSPEFGRPPRTARGQGRSHPPTLHRLSGARRPPQVPGTGPPPDPGHFHCRPRAGVRQPAGLRAVPGGRAVGALGRGEGLFPREVARRREQAQAARSRGSAGNALSPPNTTLAARKRAKSWYDCELPLTSGEKFHEIPTRSTRVTTFWPSSSIRTGQAPFTGRCTRARKPGSGQGPARNVRQGTRPRCPLQQPGRRPRPREAPGSRSGPGSRGVRRRPVPGDGAPGRRVARRSVEARGETAARGNPADRRRGRQRTGGCPPPAHRSPRAHAGQCFSGRPGAGAPGGVVKVLDLGLAKMLANRPRAAARASTSARTSRRSAAWPTRCCPVRSRCRRAPGAASPANPGDRRAFRPTGSPCPARSSRRS